MAARDEQTGSVLHLTRVVLAAMHGQRNEPEHQLTCLLALKFAVKAL